MQCTIRTGDFYSSDVSSALTILACALGRNGHVSAQDNNILRSMLKRFRYLNLVPKSCTPVLFTVRLG